MNNGKLQYDTFTDSVSHNVLLDSYTVLKQLKKNQKATPEVLLVHNQHHG